MWQSNLRLEDCLNQFCQSGWKMDKNEMGNLRLGWQRTLSSAESILDLFVEGNSACKHWATKVVQNGKLHVLAYKVHLVVI